MARKASTHTGSPRLRENLRKMPLQKDLDQQLLHVARDGTVAQARTLVQQGANVNTRSWVGPYTPVMWAVQHGKKSMALYLTRAGGDLSLRAGGRSAITMATNLGYSSIADALYEIQRKRLLADFEKNDPVLYPLIEASLS